MQEPMPYQRKQTLARTVWHVLYGSTPAPIYSRSVNMTARLILRFLENAVHEASARMPLISFDARSMTVYIEVHRLSGRHSSMA